jgi:hypothetical protein
MDITKMNQLELQGLLAQEQDKLNMAMQNIVTLKVQMMILASKPKEPIVPAEEIKP